MAWFFDESDDNVEVTDVAALTIPNADWVIGFKYWLDSNAGSQSKYIYSWGAYAANPSLNILIYEASHGTPHRMEVRSSAFATVISAGAGTTGQWYDVILERSGSTVSLYLNGVVGGSGSGAASGGLNLSTNLWIGSRVDEESARFFGGRLAEMFKMDRALSAGEKGAILRGASPSRLAGIHDATSWYLPMYRDRYVEWKNRLSLAVTGTAGAAHPPVQMPFGRHQAVFIAPEAAPPSGTILPLLNHYLAG